MSHLCLAAILAITLQNEPVDSASASQDHPVSTDRRAVPGNSPSEGTATVSPFTAAASVDPTNTSSIVELSLGTSLATGDFGSSSDTSIWSTAMGARATLGNVRLSASIPYMRLRSNATIFTGIDSTPIVVATGEGRNRTNEGFGDITLGASYTLQHDPGDIEIEVASRVKLPSASGGSGLSSGKTDYSLGLQATKAINNIAPFASLTYRFLGDPNGFDLRNGLAASVGGSAVVSRRTVLLASYHYARAASRFVNDAHELFLGFSRELPGQRLRLTGFGTAGLSSGAAAGSGGLAVSLSL